MKKEEVSIVLTPEQLKQCQSAEKKVSEAMKIAERGYLSICASVRRLTETQYYTVEGYKNNEQYMREKFGMARITCYRLCNISRRFGDPETYELLPEYKNARMRNLALTCELTKEEEESLPESWTTMSSNELQKIVKGMKSLEEKEEQEDESVDKPKKLTYKSAALESKEDCDAAKDEVMEIVNNALEEALKGQKLIVTAELK